MGLTYYGTSRAVIDSPGDYTIDRDITQPSMVDSAIHVVPGVPYVTIRLRSRIVGAYGPSSRSIGIEADGSVVVNVIGDGGCISGFAWGVQLSNAYRASVRRLAVRECYFRGVVVEGDEAAVEDCDVAHIMGALWTPNAYCMGIEVRGQSTTGNLKVLRNSVFSVAGTGSGPTAGESVGISVSDNGLNSVVQGNSVKNPVRLAKSFGLWVGGASDVTFTHNLFDGWSHGAAFSSPPVGWGDDNAYRNCGLNVLDSGGDVFVSPSDQET